MLFFRIQRLNRYLGLLRIEYLIIVGAATHVCVEPTAKGAFDKQFMNVIVFDGVASYFPDLHAAVLKSF